MRFYFRVIDADSVVQATDHGNLDMIEPSPLSTRRPCRPSIRHHHQDRAHPHTHPDQNSGRTFLSRHQPGINAPRVIDVRKNSQPRPGCRAAPAHGTISEMRGSTPVAAAAGRNPSLNPSNLSSHPGSVQGWPVPQLISVHPHPQEAPSLVRVQSGGIQPSAVPRQAKTGPTMFMELGIIAGMAEDKECVVM